MTTYAPSLPAGRVSLKGLLRSEWTKLRTVRSTMWTLGATVLIGVAASAIAMALTRAHWTTESAAARAAFDPVEVSLVGAYLGGALLLGVLGILVISGEYATGTIRATLAAEPRRPMVLAAKVLVFGAVSLIIAEVTSFASFLLGQAFLTSPARHATLSSPGALRAVAGTGLFLCVVGRTWLTGGRPAAPQPVAGIPSRMRRWPKVTRLRQRRPRPPSFPCRADESNVAKIHARERRISLVSHSAKSCLRCTIQAIYAIAVASLGRDVSRFFRATPSLISLGVRPLFTWPPRRPDKHLLYGRTSCARIKAAL